MDRIKLNIDGGGEEKEGWNNWFPALNGISGVSTCHANYIVMHRFFERMKDPHEFLKEFRFIAQGPTELYLFSLIHDDVRKWVEQHEDNPAKAFGKNHDIRWMHDYKQEEVIELFEDYGWVYEGEFDKIEDFDPPYPCRKLKFRSVTVSAPWQYALSDLKLNDKDKVIEVGPGNFAWPRADVYLEHLSRRNHPAYRDSTLPKRDKIIWGNIEAKNERIEDKQFDFALCSHVFEHLGNPVDAATELSRIAKRGIVIVPSAYKECLTCWDEQEHNWECYPSQKAGTLRMLRRNWPYVHTFRDTHVRSVFNRLFQGDDMSTNDIRKAKKWFRENERFMDVIIPWEGEFKLEIL